MSMLQTAFNHEQISLEISGKSASGLRQAWRRCTNLSERTYCLPSRDNWCRLRSAVDLWWAAKRTTQALDCRRALAQKSSCGVRNKTSRTIRARDHRSRAITASKLLKSSAGQESACSATAAATYTSACETPSPRHNAATLLRA